jgi:hypothetical protein
VQLLAGQRRALISGTRRMDGHAVLDRVAIEPVARAGHEAVTEFVFGHVNLTPATVWPVYGTNG